MGPRTWFLEIVSFANISLCVCVCVCVSGPRALITSHVKGTRNNRIRKFYSFSVSLYDTCHQ